MVDNATTFVFSSGMTVTRVVVAKNPEHWVPDASTVVLADFFGSCKVEHPSEAVDVEKFWVSLFLLPCFRLPHASSKNVSYGLLTGDAFVSNESCSFHERDYTVPFVRILPETPNVLVHLGTTSKDHHQSSTTS